jgi:hypothetical protein
MCSFVGRVGQVWFAAPVSPRPQNHCRLTSKMVLDFAAGPPDDLVVATGQTSLELSSLFGSGCIGTIGWRGEGPCWARPLVRELGRESSGGVKGGEEGGSIFGPVDGCMLLLTIVTHRRGVSVAGDPKEKRGHRLEQHR